MNVAILGSTGSIGTQTLDVCRSLGFNVVAISGGVNIALLREQAAEFNPDLVIDKSHGMDGLISVATHPKADIVVNALVGNVGFLPTVAAIEAGKNVALANKEVLVCAGELIMPLARKHGVSILPVDSEHSAIFQCLQGGQPAQKVYLTASGGPFRGLNLAELENITPKEALKHPNWSMGNKISIDSATLMNKGLEVMEAYWLFGLKASQIEVLVHPQSIIHSMVEFCDGQILAQLGVPDMRTVIQYALTHPKRVPNSFGKLDFTKHNTLTFEKPDAKTFKCLALAYEALGRGGLYPTVLNAANEVAVARFLNNEIKFLDIACIIESALSAYNQKEAQVTIQNILNSEKWAKDFAQTWRK